jgi:ankyrin repeat protein
MSSALPDRPDLSFEKKRAKALLKAFNEADPAAISRIHSHLARLKDPGSPPATLADAQFVIARERGFESWPKLKVHIEGLQPIQDQVMPFLQAACNGKVPMAQRILARHPTLPEHSFQAAAAAADTKALKMWIERRPTMAVKRGDTLVEPPPHIKPLSLPLLAACASHLHKVGAQSATASLQCVRLLLDNGADPNSKDSSDARLPALYHACVANNVPVVRLLLERGAEVNDGESVHHSAELNHRECLDLLLERGADLSTEHPQWKKTVLYFLAEIDARPEGVQWLLEHGANPNVVSGDQKETPLHQAALKGNLALVDSLLKHGADPNAARADGRTSYVLAVRSGSENIAERLRAAGARADSLTDADEFLSACMRADEAAARAVLAKAPQLLASLTPEDKNLMLQAASRDRMDVLRLMISLGFDPGTRDTWGSTALHTAAWWGKAAMAQELIRLGAPINVLDGHYGASPLGFAVHGSRFCPRQDKTDAEYCAIIDALIEAGSTPEAPVNQWKEPLNGTRAVNAHLAKRGFGPKETSPKET